MIGRAIQDHPSDVVYVTGDVCPYYAKLGYETEGRREPGQL